MHEVTTFIHPAEARRQFVEFAAGEIGVGDLARGALLIALEEYPRLDVDHYLGELAALAERVRRRGTPFDPPVFRLGYLHAEMFDVDGYHGDAAGYYEPRNAYLNEVIDRKVGLPILLSIVFLDVATRVGLNAAGVGLPGHFIVKVQFELNEIFVDPFHDGATLTMGEIATMISGMSGGQVRLTSEHLRAWTPRQTLARVLGNLQNMWGRVGEARKVLAAAERIQLLQEKVRDR
jgi:regulator of sirC expression with transglutaminase-like and TPR domain